MPSSATKSPNNDNNSLSTTASHQQQQHHHPYHHLIPDTLYNIFQYHVYLMNPKILHRDLLRYWGLGYHDGNENDNNGASILDWLRGGNDDAIINDTNPSPIPKPFLRNLLFMQSYFQSVKLLELGELELVRVLILLKMRNCTPVMSDDEDKDGAIGDGDHELLNREGTVSSGDESQCCHHHHHHQARLSMASFLKLLQSRLRILEGIQKRCDISCLESSAQLESTSCCDNNTTEWNQQQQHQNDLQILQKHFYSFFSIDFINSKSLTNIIFPLLHHCHQIDLGLTFRCHYNWRAFQWIRGVKRLGLAFGHETWNDAVASAATDGISLFSFLKGVEELDISSLQWHSIDFNLMFPHLEGSIKNLKMQRNDSVTGDSFRYFSTLTHLDMLQCSQDTIRDQHFQYLSNLRELNISYCRQLSSNLFKHLHSAAAGVAQLRYLDMRNCSQSALTNEAFQYFTGLEVLHMEHCSQEEITNEAFRHFRGGPLRELYLQGCFQYTITEGLLQYLVGVETLDISNCDFIRLDWNVLRPLVLHREQMQVDDGKRAGAAPSSCEEEEDAEEDTVGCGLRNGTVSLCSVRTSDHHDDNCADRRLRFLAMSEFQFATEEIRKECEKQLNAHRVDFWYNVRVRDVRF